MDFCQINETSLLITLGKEIDLSLPTTIALLTNTLKAAFPKKILDITPSYTTILVEYDALAVTAADIIESAKNIAQRQPSDGTPSNVRTVTLPVYYHPDVAPDLLYLSEELSLSVEEIITLHSARNYLVCAIGFAPGFAFLAEVNPRLQFPRKETPRAKVLAGSVGIAAMQTAVYPADSPGGWQIIGNCPTRLFTPESPDAIPFAVGDQVVFSSIGKEEFLSLGGSIPPCS